METNYIPHALNTLCAVLQMVISMFEPVKEWIIGASRGYITARAVKGLSFDGDGEITGLGLLLYTALVDYGCENVEVTSFTGNKAYAIKAFGTEDNDFIVLPDREDTASDGILFRATFNVDEKESGEVPEDKKTLWKAVEPLIEAHGPLFPLPTIYVNGERVDIKTIHIPLPKSEYLS